MTSSRPGADLMAIFPKIQSPCPYKGDLAAIMDGDVCRLCKRQVFDLTDMGDDQRLSFMKGCTKEVCVSYSFRRPAIAAAVALAALGAPAAAAAGDGVIMEVTELVVTGGGIKDLGAVEYFDDAADTATPELPVVYEAADDAEAPAVDAAEPA
jgi:hypothetical protein